MVSAAASDGPNMPIHMFNEWIKKMGTSSP
jgi:hypothetical protein